MTHHSPLKTVFIAFIAAIVAVTSFAPSFAAESLAPKVGIHEPVAADPWITHRVKMGLLLSEEVNGLDVYVDTIDASVTLHGSVATEGAKAAAERLARKVVGVRDVRNLIAVVPPRLEDAIAIGNRAVERRVKWALQTDPELDDSSIFVESVNDGVVVLGGKARTASDHRHALEKVRGLQGVRKVASVVDSPEQPGAEEIWRPEDQTAREKAGWSATDGWITTAAKVRLIGNPKTPALRINVDTRDGVVTLFGTVPSPEAKKAATEEVLEVAGVKRVENELQVVAPIEQPAVAARDEQVQERVAKRLESSTELEGTDIDVAVSDGVVRLTGTVNDRIDQLHALIRARATPGVRSVIDDLRIRDGSDQLAAPG